MLQHTSEETRLVMLKEDGGRHFSSYWSHASNLYHLVQKYAKGWCNAALFTFPPPSLV